MPVRIRDYSPEKLAEWYQKNVKICELCRAILRHNAPWCPNCRAKFRKGDRLGEVVEYVGIMKLAQPQPGHYKLKCRRCGHIWVADFSGMVGREKSAAWECPRCGDGQEKGE